MVYSAVTAFLLRREQTHQEVAEDFARFVQRSGGCLPTYAIPRLVEILDGVACLDGVKALMQERDDLREQVRKFSGEARIQQLMESFDDAEEAK